MYDDDIRPSLTRRTTTYVLNSNNNWCIGQEHKDTTWRKARKVTTEKNAEKCYHILSTLPDLLKFACDANDQFDLFSLFSFPRATFWIS